MRADALRADLAAVAVARACGCGASDEGSMERAMRALTRDLGAPELMVHCVERFHPGRAVDVDPSAFEDSWRHTRLGAFVAARAAALSISGRRAT